MFSLFRDAEGLRTMLRDREPELVRTLEQVRGRQEFLVRVFRVDHALLASLGELSPRIAEMESTAAAASPGQQYLLQRKLEAERREELARVATDIAQQVLDTLSGHAEAAAVEPIPRQASPASSGTAVLNASFLLRRDDTAPFRRALTALIDEHEPRGFRFEFTGPWPPYHFVREQP
jgi:hypothetical protein